MNTGNFEVQEKKLKFPIGAIFIAVAGVLSIEMRFEAILYTLALLAIAAVFIITKSSVKVAIPVAVAALAVFIKLVVGLKDMLEWYHTAELLLLIHLVFEFFVLIHLVFEFFAFIAFGLFALSDVIPAVKENQKKVKNTLLVFLIASIVLNVMSSFTDIGSIIATIVCYVGVMLSIMWFVDPYAKEKEYNDEIVVNGVAVNSKNYISLGAHICLLLFTFGIWQFIWVYRTTAFTNIAKGEEERNPVTKLLLCMFVPFYNIYWTYITAKRIDKIAREKGIHSDLGTMCLLLAIFIPIVAPIIMQAKINETLISNGTTEKQSHTDDAEALKKYKELLEQGIITQEEFDAKKKQILGL